MDEHRSENLRALATIAYYVEQIQKRAALQGLTPSSPATSIELNTGRFYLCDYFNSHTIDPTTRNHYEWFTKEMIPDFQNLIASLNKSYFYDKLMEEYGIFPVYVHMYDYFKTKMPHVSMQRIDLVKFLKMVAFTVKRYDKEIPILYAPTEEFAEQLMFQALSIERIYTEVPWDRFVGCVESDICKDFV